jgi:hypothetical protein
MGTDSVSAWLADPKEGLQLYENSKVSSSERAVKCLQVLLDRYRCPESFLDFEPNRNLSGDTGYFQFGADAIC